MPPRSNKKDQLELKIRHACSPGQLDKTTVQELRDMCQVLGVKCDSRAKKADICSKLAKHIARSKVKK